jgi:hypothetical protein
MARFGRFVDARTIHQRMARKDARIARELAQRSTPVPLCQWCGDSCDCGEKPCAGCSICHAQRAAERGVEG